MPKQINVASRDFYAMRKENNPLENRCTGIPRPTARRILNLLRDNGLLKMIRAGKGRRPGIYVFPELVNIAEGTPVF